MKAQTQKKLTKRQLKALRGPNAAVQNSLKFEEHKLVSGATYRGRNPEYSFNPLTKQWSKSRSGVPFVRVG